MIIEVYNYFDMIFLYDKFSKFNFHCIIENGEFNYYKDNNSGELCTSNKLLIQLFLSKQS